MLKQKQNLNTIYISERLRESLKPISHCTLTTVVAPMGYGKTTAINWYLAERTKREELCVIRINVYSDNLAIFWKSVQDAFTREGFRFLREYPCPSDAAGGSLLADDLCHELNVKKSFYIFIDDFHLLSDDRVSNFICRLAKRLPQNVHFIIASRNQFLPASEIICLSGRLHQIGTKQLRLNHTELSVYVRKCGTDLSDEQLKDLLYSTEGWFSAIYLNLRTFSGQAALPDHNSDIYGMFTSAMIDPLPKSQREFLAVMGLADEFTIEMAKFVTDNPDVEKILSRLTAQNAFVKRLPDGSTYRFHHMMKECASQVFQMLEKEKQSFYQKRFALWYEEHKQYLHALNAYRQSEDYDGLLRVIQKDAGILLSSLNPDAVLSVIDNCPASTLKEHPLSLLVLMRSMFNWNRFPKMMEMRSLLMASIEEHTEMSARERGNLLGECDLIMSFLCYNDISAMSRLHRSASNQMSRPAISIHKSGGWTFGSPSVLMMFHREPGAIKKELAEMDECMPHYYKITDGHGQGAEKIMWAEAALMQGQFSDTLIALETAYSQIEGNGQENMALCCDFLAQRLFLCTDIKPHYTFEQRYNALLGHHNAAWINIWNAICAYYYALRREPAKIPEIFADHMLSSIHILAPGRPMIEMIENQVYLAQGAYAKVIGRSENQLAACQTMHYELVRIHLLIQTAAAYEMLGKRIQGQKLLLQAMSEAVADNFLLPFAENYIYLKPLLESCTGAGNQKFLQDILDLCQKYEVRQQELDNAGPRPMVLSSLTNREHEIVMLLQQRLSNREIGEKLFLSEGSVKQYINQIYSKLHIGGDTRTKRKQLLELLSSNN